MKLLRKLQNSLPVQLGIAMIIFIVAIEVVVYCLTVDSRRMDFLDLEVHIIENLKLQGIVVQDIFSDTYFDHKINEFKRNVIWSVSGIIFVVVLGVEVIFFWIAGRHIKKLYEVNKETSLDHPVFYPTDKIPKNELGESISIRNQMLKDILKSHDMLSAHRATFEMAKVSNKLAHEILNPLTIINGTAEMVKDLYDDETYSKEDLKIDLETIILNSKRINLIIRKLDDLSKTLSDKESEMICFCDLIDSYVKDFKSTHQIEIKTDFKECCDGKFKEEQLRLLFSNLFENSLLAFNGDREQYVKIETKCTENRFQIIYSDTLLNSDEGLQMLFDGTEVNGDDSGRAAGANLLIVKSILAANHGEIKLLKEEDKTKILLSLPRSK